MVLLLALALGLSMTATAHGAASDPLYVFTPAEVPSAPPPTGNLNGPCGLAVDSAGYLYVSDYYHDSVDVFEHPSSSPKYSTQLPAEDPTDGPCGLALGPTNQLYVNNLHRNVVRYGTRASFGSGSVFPLPAEDTAHHLPTGVAVEASTGRVYVDHRTYVSVFSSTGVPIEEGGQPLLIGKGSLEDGYGVAVSNYPGTAGRIYVPDAATNTVKVYEPALDKVNPVASIKDPFGHPFTSLTDAAIAVDPTSGAIYFTDDLQPEATEKPQASIYAYTPANAYLGRLKYNVIDALPAGLAVDGSGNVYVTSGNTDFASIYAYTPGSATFAAPLAPLGSGLKAPGSSGEGAVEGSAPASAAQGGAADVSLGASATAAPAAQVKVKAPQRRRRCGGRSSHRRVRCGLRHRRGLGAGRG